MALPGETASGFFAGGSHGGKGWFGSPWDIGGWERIDLAPSGSVYDSVRDPHLPGSGGSSDSPGDAGGRGGGVVRLLADTAQVRLAGDIRADGQTSAQGGGAGGAVLLRALRIDGGGTISAAGGHGSLTGRTGGGGGGRIAVLYGEPGPTIDLASQASTRGGADSHNPGYRARYAGAGTVYLEQFDAMSGNASGLGELVIANASGKPAALTPLPGLGNATLLAVDAAAREVTIEAPEAVGDVTGDSLVALDGSGSELAAHRITSQIVFPQPDGLPRRLSLGVAGSEEDLLDLGASIAGSTITVRTRSRLAKLEGRGAARIVVTDDIAIGPPGEATPAVNDRNTLTLEGEARALLRGEGPTIALESTPPAGSDVPLGSTVFVHWTITDPLGLASRTENWSLTGAPATTVLVEPTSVDNAAQPRRLEIGGAPPGPATFSLGAVTTAGRSASIASSWNVLPNQPPTVSIAFAPGTPAAVLPGRTVVVVIDAADAEGLEQITLYATGPLGPTVQSVPVSGYSAHLELTLTVAQTAEATESVEVRAEVLDLYAPAPTVSSTLEPRHPGRRRATGGRDGTGAVLGGRPLHRRRRRHDHRDRKRQRRRGVVDRVGGRPGRRSGAFAARPRVDRPTGRLDDHVSRRGAERGPRRQRGRRRAYGDGAAADQPERTHGRVHMPEQRRHTAVGVRRSPPRGARQRRHRRGGGGVLRRWRDDAVRNRHTTGGNAAGVHGYRNRSTYLWQARRSPFGTGSVPVTPPTTSAIQRCSSTWLTPSPSTLQAATTGRVSLAPLWCCAAACSRLRDRTRSAV